MNPKNDTIESVLEEHNYKYVKKIGQGKFGHVFLVNNLKYNTNMVVKIITNKVESIEVKQEIEQLMKLDHPHIIRVYDYWYLDDYLFIVMRYCENGSFEHYIKTNGVPRIDKLREWFKQILSAIAYCHSKGISHSDIKPANILLDEHERAQLVDFGLSRSYEKGEMAKGMMGTPATMSPEMIKDKHYDPIKSDIWSLGVTFYWIATESIPWEIVDVKSLLKHIATGAVIYPKTMDKLLTALLRAMLKEEPNERKTAEQLLKFPFFKTIRPIVRNGSNTRSSRLFNAGISIAVLRKHSTSVEPHQTSRISLPRHLTISPVPNQLYS